MPQESDRIEFTVRDADAGLSLRVFLGDMLPLEPLSLIRHLIAAGKVHVGGRPTNPKTGVCKGDGVSVLDLSRERSRFRATALPAEVLYEDDHVLVLNKPAGCTVTTRRGMKDCPFQNGVLEYLRRCGAGSGADAEARYRPRTIHRLDQDTTGAIIEAKSRRGELHLAAQFQERTVRKEYLAVVRGEPEESRGTVTEPIAATPRDLARMQVDTKAGKPSVTQYEVAERFHGFARVRATPVTGRRHQIRVHFAHIGHPIVADEVYGGGNAFMLSSVKRRYRLRDGETEKPIIARPALHAAAITFLPVSAQGPVRVEAPLPRDIQLLLKMLRKYARGGHSGIP